MSFRVAILQPDVHLPYCDYAALDVMFSIIEDLPRVDEFCNMGDLLDCFGVNLHDEMPETFNLKTRLKEEIVVGNKYLDFLQRKLREKNKDCAFKMTLGNHEKRVARYIVKKAPALYEFLDIPSLLQLDERDFEWHRFTKNQLAQVLNTNLYFRHRPYSGGVNTANSTLNKKAINLVYGDTHRLQFVKRKRGDLSKLQAISLGCMIDFESPAFAYCDVEDWAHAFGIVYQYSDDPEDWVIDVVEIDRGKAIYGGVLYEGNPDKPSWAI